jgi:hypothetical protein
MRRDQRASGANPSLYTPTEETAEASAATGASGAGASDAEPSDAGAGAVAAPAWPGTSWADRLVRRDFAGVIREYVAMYEPVTFPEIGELLRPYIPVDGDCGLQVGDDEQCVLYGDLSAELAEILHEMLAQRQILARPAITLYYAASHPLRRLPVLIDVPDHPLTQPHWLPCTLHVQIPTTVKPVHRPAEVN